MERNMVYELAKTLNQTNGLEKDFLQMASSLKESVEKNYIQKIQMAAGTQKAFAVEHPPKEVALLRALSPFLDDAGRGKINEVTHSLLLLHSLENISHNVENLTQEGGLLATRSAEGEEDFLPPATTKMAGLLLALSLVDLF